MRSTASHMEHEYNNEARAYTRIDDTLLQSISWLCHHYGNGRTEQGLLAGLAHANIITPSIALSALQNAGITGGLVQRGPHELPEQVMPIILLRKVAGGAVLLSRTIKKNEQDKREYFYQVILPEVSLTPVEIPHSELITWYAGYAILAKPVAKVEATSMGAPVTPAGHWLFSTLWRYRSYYRSAAIATILINVLALASVFFTMNVYDRVIPNQAFVTLWSLAIGVTLAMFFEALSRFVRAHLLDTAGKKADLVIGSILFRQAISIRMEHKPPSSGVFANQVREFESLRDFVSSATLASIIDLPFVLLFVAVIFSIGGWLGFVPLLMLPTLIVISLIIQWPLSRIMKENLREASLKQGVLIESVKGMETLKSTHGEAWMQRRWENFSGLQASSAMKSKKYSSLATGCAAFFQQLQTVFIVVIGVYLISDGTLSQGALIGSVLLSSRATAPLSQVVGLAVRFQQARASLKSLNQLMDMPVDRDKEQDYLRGPKIGGNIELKSITFAYPAPPMQPNPQILKKISMCINAGERVAILGRVGSGKSTLLRIIARLFQPTSGQIFADALDVNQIDPADWRAAVGYVEQQPCLFYGSLRENIMIGCQEATAGELLRVLQLTGLDKVVAEHPAGINLPVGEGGESLSGGQRQLVTLARMLINRPEIILMDEPTSAMDAQTEQHFIKQLSQSVEHQTLVVVTHRPSLLALVNRIIVVEGGEILMDGPKDVILQKLKGENQSASSGQVVAHDSSTDSGKNA